MRRNVSVALLCTAVVGIAVGAWYWTEQEEVLDVQPASLAQEERDYAPPTPIAGDPTGMRKYENAAYRFSLFYPDTLAVREYTEKGNALSVTFEDTSGTRGFQIYATPYSNAQITEERFLLDSPAGVMNEPTDILVDGTTATMFFGKHSLMGETREVWFIKGGYLYEVATYKELDEWLSSIMATWRFY